MADEIHPHTKSEGLKRLLRRRGRRHKVSANTGDKVYSWAEYGQVNFTPSGDSSFVSRLFGIFAILMAFLIVPIIFLTAQYTADGPNRIVDMLLMGLLGFGVIGFAAILLMFFVASVRMFVDILADRRERRQKRLIRTHDAGANHAK